MPKSSGRHFRRSDLFVVRIWCEDLTDTSDPYEIANETEEGATATSACRGRVQRAVNGEAHDFQGWPALIQVLEAMLSAAPPARKTAATPDGKHGANNVSE